MRFGYHVKLAGSPVSTIRGGEEAGCDTIQMFPGSPRQWGTPKASDEDARAFREAKEEAGIDPVIIHSIYLVNIASPSDQVFKRSVSSLVSALNKADKLGANAVVTHIGNHKGEGERSGLERIAAAVNSCLEMSHGESMLLLETTAGAGTSIGGRFEQFGEVFDISGAPDRLGVCLDTCHIFAAGYDIRTPGGVDDALEELDKFIGLGRLKLLHLNDSKAACGSHTDRHEHIGQGMIGLEAFRYIVNHEALGGLPAIIELAYGGSNPDDIGLLRSLVRA